MEKTLPVALRCNYWQSAIEQNRKTQKTKLPRAVTYKDSLSSSFISQFS